MSTCAEKINKMIYNCKAFGLSYEALVKSIENTFKGARVVEHKTGFLGKAEAYYFLISDTEFVVYICDEVKSLDFAFKDRWFNGNVYVLGGKDLESLDDAFINTLIKGNLDLSLMDNKNLKLSQETLTKNRINNVIMPSD